MPLLAMLLYVAASFWETKAPADWTDDELIRLLTDSPWAQMAAPNGVKETHAAPVQVYLATAGPMRDADQERDRRYSRKRPGPVVEDPMATEYRLWLEDNKGEQIVVAVRIPRTKDFDDGAQTKRMEEECVMLVGRKKYKMTGSFPPTQRDVYLRLAFPRQVLASDKTVTFELYLPGVSPPYRTVEFKVKDMMVKGKLEM
jgi:hypothetical protein